MSVEPEIPRDENGDAPVMVSVIASAFNHERWIAEALDSFVAQQVKFAIEILVHDDASTDSTPAIIREYAAKHPGLIKPVLQTENQFAKKNYGFLTLAHMARGKYVAMCECDDYWTDPHKLQKQVEALERHPECSMCVAMTDVHEWDGQRFVLRNTIAGPRKEFLYLQDFLDGCYVHTSTYLMPRENLLYVAGFNGRVTLGDTAIRFLLLQKGPFVFIREVMSVYRQTGSGIWSSLSLSQRALVNVRMLDELRRHSGGAVRREYSRLAARMRIEALVATVHERQWRSVPIRVASVGHAMARHPVLATRLLAERLANLVKRRRASSPS